MELTIKKSIGTTIVNSFFLIVLNLSLMAIFGYLTMDSEANLNSRAGAVLLSALIPYFIVSVTQSLGGMERLLKFGFGFISYIILAVAIVGFPTSFVTGLIPCLVICLGVLYYGNDILKLSNFSG